MEQRREIDARAGLMMTALCATWGLQQTAMKAAAADMAPTLQVALRSGVAALLLYGLVLLRREAAGLGGGAWRPGLVVGGLFALEFLLIGEGLRFTSASHMAIFLYTAPIFTALGLHASQPQERLSPMQWAGIGLAFTGVVIAFAGGPASGPGAGAWIGDLLGVAAGAALGATTLTIRLSRLAGAPATVTLLFQLLGAFALLLPAAVLLGQARITVTPVLMASLGFQTLLVSLASFLAWFSLLRVYLASRLGVLSFMTPIFGVAFGVTLLGERLDPGFVAGTVTVLAGILVVNSRDLVAGRRPA